MWAQAFIHSHLCAHSCMRTHLRAHARTHACTPTPTHTHTAYGVVSDTVPRLQTVLRLRSSCYGCCSSVGGARAGASLPLPLGQCRASSTHPLATGLLGDAQGFKVKSREGNCSRGLDYCLGNIDFSQGSKISLRRVSCSPQAATIHLFFP